MQNIVYNNLYYLTAIFRSLLELQRRLVNGLKEQCKDDIASGKKLTHLVLFLPSYLQILISSQIFPLNFWPSSKTEADNLFKLYFQVK
jgi:hypothetical protein